MNVIRQAVSLIIILNFFFDPGIVSFCFAHRDRTAMAQPALDKLSIPEMTRGDYFIGDSELKMILFRDLHAQEEAQLKISRALQYLHQRLNVHQVFIEGAQGALQRALYEAFPDEKVRAQVAGEFLKEGYLSGSEYAGIRMGINSGIQLFGIENHKLYLENFKVFRQTRLATQEFGGKISRIDGEIAALKKTIFSRHLLEADRILEAMHDPGFALYDLVARSEVFFESLDAALISEDRLESWNKMRPAREQFRKASEINPENIKNELRRLVSFFQKKLAKEDLRRVISAGLKYQIGQMPMLEYLSELRSVYHKNSASRDSFRREYPDLNAWIKLARKLKSLDLEAIWESLKRLFGKLRQDLALHADEKALVEFLNRWRLFKKLVRLELSREELSSVQAQKAVLFQELIQFLSGHRLAGDLQDPSALECLTRALDFYDLALLRDRIMVENALNRLRSGNAGKGESRTGVMITGGFHTKGIEEILKEHRISYAVYTPHLQKDADPSLYEKRMMDESYDLEKVDFSISRQIFGRQIKPAGGMLSPPILLSGAFDALGTPLFEVKLRMLRAMVARVQGHYDSLNDILNAWMGKIENLTRSEFQLLFEALDAEEVFSKLTDMDPGNAIQKEIALASVKKAYADPFPSLVKLTEIYFSKDAPARPEALTAGLNLEALEPREKAAQAAGFILEVFDRYWSQFNEITLRARERFEKAQWQELQTDVLDRMTLYGKALDEMEVLRSALGDTAEDPAFWERIRREFLMEIRGRYNHDLALTTLYSGLRRIFSRKGVPVEYSDEGAVKTSSVKAPEPYAEYPADEVTPKLVEAILNDVPLHLGYAKLERQSQLIAERLNAALTQSFGSARLDAVEMLQEVFYRNKEAYVVGRIRAGDRMMPLVFCLQNMRGLLDVHAVLTHETDVSNLFTYTRSNFHVNLHHQYRELVDFLETIMPSKGRAAIYSAIGFIHPAKIELIREFRAALRKSRGRLALAKGTPGTTVTVFGRRGFPYLFKVPKEIPNREGWKGRDQVIAQYHKVHDMDRVGRILDASHYYDLRLQKKMFSDEVLEELKTSSPEGVRITGDHVTFRNVYLQRKVTPLEVYLRAAGGKKAKQAVIEFGNCIRDLAAAGIWPGSFSLENFGVTAHGRVVLYDSSTVDALLDYEFTQAPADSMIKETQALEKFPDDKKVVYPEFIGQFIPRNLRAAFRFAHGELYQYRFWQRVQEQLRRGEIRDFYPYPMDRILEAGAAEVEKIADEPRFFSAGIKVDEVDIEGLAFARLSVNNPEAAKVLVIEPVPPVIFAEFQEKFPAAQFDVLLPESELSREGGHWKSGIQGKLTDLVRGRDYDYVIGYVNENYDAGFFEAAKLRGLVLLSTATHHVDLEAAAKSRTAVTNAPGPTTIPVAENLIAFALDSLYDASVGETKGLGKRRLTQLTASEQNAPAIAQILWYSLMRKVLRLDELFEFGASARYVRVGVSEGATVYHGKLGQHPADLAKMSIGIIGLDEVGLKLAELAIAHEVSRIYVLESEMNEQAQERLLKMKDLVEAVSSTQGLRIEVIPAGFNEMLSQSTFVLRTPDGYRKISKERLTDVDIDSHELFLSDPEVLSHSLQGLTVGIVGLGRIGEAAAQRFLALGARVLVHQRGHERAQYVEKKSRLTQYAKALGTVFGQDLGVEFADKEPFLERSNVIAVSVSLSDETRGWLNGDALKLFGTLAEKPARALLSITKDIIDEASLIPYLRTHPQVHVRMDVASNEQRGNVAKRFVDENGRALERVKVGGHTAAAVWEMRREKVNLALMNLLALIQGETPVNALNPVPEREKKKLDKSRLEESIARAHARNLIKKYGALQTAQIIIRAADELGSSEIFSEMGGVDSGKMRAWLLDELTSELADLMRTVEERGPPQRLPAAFEQRILTDKDLESYIRAHRMIQSMA